MSIFIKDIFNNDIRLTEERGRHFKKNHPVFTEISDWTRFIDTTLRDPDAVIRSKSDDSVNLYYRFFQNTVVGDKYLCVVVKKSLDYFIVTVYFTDKIKEGGLLWKK